jgi:hypothetical protein
MNRRIPLTAATAGGGLLAAAFLQAVVAAAETDGDTGTISDNAFTVDGTTFVGTTFAGTDGFNDVHPIFGIAPLLEIGGGQIQQGVFLAPQDLEVSDSSGADLGSVTTGVNASNILGIDSAQFTVSGVTPTLAEIQSGLADASGISFGAGTDFDAADLAAALAARNLDFGSTITADDITTALVDTPIGNALGINYLAQFDPDDVEPGITFTPSAAADALNAVSTADLPADGTVYSLTNLGGGFENVYAATPNADGTAAASITDTVQTPFGNFDIPTTYDAVANLDPGSAFDGLAVNGGAADLSDNAFTIDGTTFDPGAGGFDTVIPLFGIAPLLEIGGGNLGSDIVNPSGFSDFQNLEVYNSGSDQGSVTTGVDTSNILGIDSTQLTVTSSAPSVDAIENALNASSTDFSTYDDVSTRDIATALVGDPGTSVLGGDVNQFNVIHVLDFPFGTPIVDFDEADFTAQDIADALNAAQAPDLPADGTVYSVTDLGGGYENVYEAIPNADGTAAASITDTLVTPFGNFDIPTTFDAVAKLDPGSAFDGLAAGGGTGDLSDNAFTIDGTTFDPGADGFDGVTPLFGIAPLLELGGLSAGPGVNLAGQSLEIYDSSGADLGNVTTGLFTSNILGIDSTQFTITGVAGAAGATADQLPDVGTVYSVTDLGGGYENVYEAIPNEAGTAASSITDTLVTPFGNFDLSTLYDAVADLMPGDAVAGADASGADLFGDFLGGS